MEQLDKFAQRLNSYSVPQIEYSIACEDLVKKNFGKVHRKCFTLKPKSLDCSMDAVDNLVKRVSELSGGSLIIDDRFVRYFITDNWTAQLVIETQVDGKGDTKTVHEESSGRDETEPSMGSTNDDRQKKEFVRKVNIDLNTLDFEVFKPIEDAVDELGFVIISGFDVESGIPVTFAFPGERGPEYHTQSFEGITLEGVACNYSESVISSVRTLLKYTEEVTHGLVLISGPVGTGKSYLIRSILTEIVKRRAIVCTPATQFLIQVGLLAQVVANFRKSIVILEDVGEVVAIDAASRYIDARSNLLNFSEGFLSLLTDSIVVISFNYEIDKVDPAIVRPGRCLANIKVGTLSQPQVRKLVPFEIPSGRSYTLADVYEMRRVGNADFLDNRSEVGFKGR